MNQKKRFFMGAACLIALGAPQASWAGAVTTFSVNTTVGASCTVGATPMNFPGATSDSLQNQTAESIITANCSSGAAYTIGLNNGQNYDGSDRRMRLNPAVPGSNFIKYKLYKDSAHSTVWGNAGTDLQSGIGTGADEGFTVYGKITDPSNTITEGNYQDIITVTLTYNPSVSGAGSL